MGEQQRSVPFAPFDIISRIEAIHRHKQSNSTSNAVTPFYVYDEKGIRETARQLCAAFRERGFEYKNYFAVKALPNPEILRILLDEGMGLDCSSFAELLLAERLGVAGKDIMFTSNNTSIEEFCKANQMGVILNFDDLAHIDFFTNHVLVSNGQEEEQEAGSWSLDEHSGKEKKKKKNKSSPLLRQHCVSCRYNPGPLRSEFGDGRENSVIIGNPQEAKFGMPREHILQAYSKLKQLGVTNFGLHTMIASNELDPKAFVETVKMLLGLVREICTHCDIPPHQFRFINIGGGMGIPYRPHQQQQRLPLTELSQAIRRVFDEFIAAAATTTNNNNGDRPDFSSLRLYSECGRFVTGPHGYLVTRVRHLKRTYKNYIGVDANMSDLMRPGMYGAYHHITHFSRTDEPAASSSSSSAAAAAAAAEAAKLTTMYDVVGSLCENNDKFAVDRMLPSEIKPGDVLVIHDAGAHGHAMGFNYNGKLRCAEYLLLDTTTGTTAASSNSNSKFCDGTVRMIRRAETYEDLFATLNL